MINQAGNNQCRSGIEYPDFRRPFHGMGFSCRSGQCADAWHVEADCEDEGESLRLHRMNDALSELVKEVWKRKEEAETGMLRYFTVRLLHELTALPCESESNLYFIRSQLAIVKEAEAIILQDLSRRITARELAERFGITRGNLPGYLPRSMAFPHWNFEGCQSRLRLYTAG